MNLQFLYKVLSVGVYVPPSNNGRSNNVWSLSVDISGLQVEFFLSNKEVVLGAFWI